MVAGKEHHHQLGRVLELVPVGFAPELGNAVAHQLRERQQLQLALVFIRRRHRVEIVRDRCLGIHHDGLAGRQLDDQIRPQVAGFGAHRLLLGEVAVVQHARHLHDAAQLDLAPLAPRDRRAQGLHQVRGLRPELLARIEELAHLLHQALVRTLARDFERLDLQVKFTERFLDGRDRCLGELQELV